MKVTIEVLADDRDDVVTLVREIATKLKRRKEESGKTVNYCMGDYRVIVENEYDLPLRDPDECHTCDGFGHLREDGTGTVDRRERKCLNCNGTGKRLDRSAKAIPEKG